MSLSDSERKERLEKVFMLCDGRLTVPDPHQPSLYGGVAEVPQAHEPHPGTICTEGYAEPGYTDSEVATVLGNWNCPPDEPWVPSEVVDPEHEDTEVGEVLTLGRALELLGCELEWEDEWTTCNDCGKLVRTSPDSYSWTRSYCELEGDIVCSDCVKRDPSDFIKSKVGNDRSCITFDFDLEPHGFVRLAYHLQNGLYGGQQADPKVIGKALRKRGISRYLFVLDSVGQFDLDFSVWVDKDELEMAGLTEDEGLPREDTDAADDPAEMMSAYLKDSARAQAAVPPGDGPVVVQPDPNDPRKAVARRVSPQDFIDGKALNGKDG